MTDLSQIDFSVATEADLADLSIESILSHNVEDYDLSTNLPDGAYALAFDKMELSSKAADPENNKKASVNLRVTYTVMRVLKLEDGSIDPATLEGRKHTESYLVSYDFGIRGLICTILSVVGVSWRDKQAIKDVGRSASALLHELVDNKVTFGATIKTKTNKQGYENCNIAVSEKSFINMNAIFDMLA